MKKLTKAQIWALKRNTTKRRLKGLSANLGQLLHDPQALTEVEYQIVDAAKSLLDYILETWNDRNELSKNAWFNREEER